MKFLLWLILAVLSWPLAVLVLILYPIIWLFSIPLRLIGISVDGALGIVRAIVTMPQRLLQRGRGQYELGRLQTQCQASGHAKP